MLGRWDAGRVGRPAPLNHPPTHAPHTRTPQLLSHPLSRLRIQHAAVVLDTQMMAAAPFAAALPALTDWDDASRSCRTMLNFVQALVALAPLVLQARALLARQPTAHEAARADGHCSALLRVPARCAEAARHWYRHSNRTERLVCVWFVVALIWMLCQTT